MKSSHRSSAECSFSDPVSDFPLAGKTVAVAGKFKGETSEEMQGRILYAGGIPVDSITPETDFLIIGTRPGAKKAQAENLGVSILDQDAIEKTLATSLNTFRVSQAPSGTISVSKAQAKALIIGLLQYDLLCGCLRLSEPEYAMHDLTPFLKQSQAKNFFTSVANSANKGDKLQLDLDKMLKNKAEVGKAEVQAMIDDVMSWFVGGDTLADFEGQAVPWTDEVNGLSFDWHVTAVEILKLADAQGMKASQDSIRKHFPEAVPALFGSN